MQDLAAHCTNFKVLQAAEVETIKAQAATMCTSNLPEGNTKDHTDSRPERNLVLLSQKRTRSEEAARLQAAEVETTNTQAATVCTNNLPEGNTEVQHHVP